MMSPWGPAAFYFAAVLAVLALLSIWLSACIVATVALVVYLGPAVYGWRTVVEAVFMRYIPSPERELRARSAIPWVVAVLAGVAISFVIGATRGC
jgi:hypothetical protein